MSPWGQGGEDKADRKGDGKSRNGQACSSPSIRGHWKTEKMEETGCDVICGAQTIPVVKV